jgi:hypothetical protein
MTPPHAPGLLAIWNDIEPDARADFLAWHSREHVPERVGVPGFVRGRRLFDAHAAPQYLTLYDVESLTVLTGAAYLDRLNAPTPWTQRTVKHFLRTERMACRVAARIGTGSGGQVITARFWLEDPASTASLEQHLVTAATGLSAATGACTAVVGCNDSASTSVSTSERRLRTGDAVPADLVLMLEVFDRSSDPAPLLASVRERCAVAGVHARPRVDLYALEFALGREP